MHYSGLKNFSIWLKYVKIYCWKCISSKPCTFEDGLKINYGLFDAKDKETRYDEKNTLMKWNILWRRHVLAKKHTETCSKEVT